MGSEAKASFVDNLKLLQAFISQEEHFSTLEKAASDLAQAFRGGKKLLSCGNGGSACDALHVAQEFTGRFRGDRKALPAISLTDPTHITCVGNDYGFDEIFARGVEAYGHEGDMLIAISTSGNSPNVIRAVEVAQEKGLLVLCLLGKEGGKLKGEADYEFIIPGKTSDRIQEIHMIILHVLIELVEREMFPSNY